MPHCCFWKILTPHQWLSKGMSRKNWLKSFRLGTITSETEISTPKADWTQSRVWRMSMSVPNPNYMTVIQMLPGLSFLKTQAIINNNVQNDFNFNIILCCGRNGERAYALDFFTVEEIINWLFSFGRDNHWEFFSSEIISTGEWTAKPFDNFV